MKKLLRIDQGNVNGVFECIGGRQMKRLILIESGEKYQFDTLEELVKVVIDKNYYEMTNEEKKEKMELKAFANCLQKKIEIVKDIEKGIEFDGKFIIFDEITYVFSLLLLGKVMLLESTESNIFTMDLDKGNISDNYIIVNHFAKDLLRKYIDKKGE